MAEVTPLYEPIARAIGWRGTVVQGESLAAALVRVTWLPLACLSLALLSIGLQGFQMGVDNNVFHLPIVLRWYDLPQFADDATIQSLRRYATPVFTLLGYVANDRNVGAIFFAAHLATRTLTFFALAQIAGAVGLGGARQAALLTVIALSVAVYGDTAIGRDEMFVGLFTHTALAQAVALLSLAWLVRGRLVLACVAAGLAFDLNVMVGAWQIAPIALVALMDMLHGRAPLRRLMAGAGGFAVIAAPVLVWILTSQDLRPAPFDYRAFLTDYYPFHFFIGWATWPQRIGLALQALGGLAATRFLPQGGRRAGGALAGFCILFLGGALIDQVTHARFVLNLHLLRADAMIAWTAAALMAAAAITCLSTKRLALVPGAVAVLVGLVLGQWWLAAAGMALLAVMQLMSGRAPNEAPKDRRFPLGPTMATAATAIAAVVCLTGGAYSAVPAAPTPGAVPTDAQLAGWRPASPEWFEVAQWARASSPKGAIFLVPWRLDFTVTAQRRSWVGWKEGAVAMWAPEDYAAWRTRGSEVRALRTVRSELAYACSHGIDYVVLDKRPAQGLADAAAAPALYANRWFSVVRPQPCAAP